VQIVREHVHISVFRLGASVGEERSGCGSELKLKNDRGCLHILAQIRRYVGVRGGLNQVFYRLMKGGSL